MVRKLLCVAVMLAVVAAGAASAQSKNTGPKLYRWVDKQGKVHYDDALPPEAVDQARREFNAKTGAATGSVDRALTAEERAQQEAAQKAAEEAALLAGEQKRQEEIMLASYATEADLSRSYGERIGLLKMTLESTDISIRSLRENLASMLSQASDAELEGRRVMEDRVKKIRELHAEKIKQQAFQVNRRLELGELNAEYERMLVRYRELRNPSPAPAMPPVSPPPGQAPLTGAGPGPISLPRMATSNPD